MCYNLSIILACPGCTHYDLFISTNPGLSSSGVFSQDITARYPGLDKSVQPVINIDQFDYLLRYYGYNSERINYLVNGLRHGFDIGFSKQITNTFAPNSNAVHRRSHILKDLIDKELAHGRFLGPFSSPPFNQMHVNPLNFVPKKTPNTFRLIDDLSLPKGSSTNEGIPRSRCTVSYPTIQNLVDALLHFVKSGYDPHLFKMDMKSAFRIIPMSPRCFPLLVVEFQGFFYIDAFLPMGCAASCRIFQEFSEAVAFLTRMYSGVPFLLNYLDDHIGLVLSDLHGFSQYEATRTLWRLLGIPWSIDKDEPPARCVMGLGIDIDITKRELRLPQEKIDKGLKAIAKVLARPCISLKQIQKLHGYLNYCASIISVGRAFLKPLSHLMRGCHTFPITVPPYILADLRVWETFLRHFNGKVMMQSSLWDEESALCLETDSSGSWGCGAMFLQEYFSVKWPTGLPVTNLARLELYPIVLAMEVWVERMANQRVLIFCDNEATVHILRKLKAEDPLTHGLVRHFALCCLRRNIIFRAKHVPGVMNKGPDALSRGQLHKFHAMFPHMQPVKTLFPDFLSPESVLMP